MLNGPLGKLMRWAYRPKLEGWENLPEGPALIVANHNACGLADAATISTLWVDQFGGSRPLAGIAHPVGFLLPGIATYLKEVGAVPSTYEHIEGALAAGVPVLIYPGGDHDAFRPIWQAKLVDFNRRKGFLRIAQKANVPIVPLGYRGAHYTIPILWRSKLLPWIAIMPRAIGAKRLPITVTLVIGLAAIAIFAWPYAPWLAGLLAFLWINSPLAYWYPLVPWNVTLHLGEALPPDELFSEDDPQLDAAYDRVIAKIQALVDPTR